ncbi:MAG: homoserine kinase [Oscillospiraceae bacterium]
MISITVPATSANMGSGFDSMGVALKLTNVISMCPSDTIDITALGGYKVRRDAGNLIYKTAAHIYELCGKTLNGLKIIEDAKIPKTRGLGSSSACIVGAVTVSVMSDGHVYYTKIKPLEKLGFIAFIPEFHLETGRARAALRGYVSHEDARFNLSRAALLAASLATGKFKNINVAMQDKIHQKERFAMIPGGERLCAALRSCGALGTYISGAGPTIIAVCRDDSTQLLRKISARIGSEYDGWRIVPLDIAAGGARVSIDK